MENNILKNCQRCGNEFNAERNTAKYCGNTCKTMANRERRKNEQIALLQEQEQAQIDEKLRLKKETLKEKREQSAAVKAEKQRISDIELEKLEELKRIASEELRLTNEKEAADQAILDQQLEAVRLQSEIDARITANNKSASDAAVLKSDLEKKTQDSKEDVELQVKRAAVIETIVIRSLNFFFGPKKDADK